LDIKDFKIGWDKTWAAWLASVTPIAVKLIREMNERAIPVGRLRAVAKAEEESEDLPPDLPGVYGFFTADANDKLPLVKFGETFELFARLVSHVGVKPVKKIVPPRYTQEKNSFSGDSSFRVKIARALNLLDEKGWKKHKAELRGEMSEAARRINLTIDQYRVAWQPLLSGRAELQTWAEWSNDEETSYRASQMSPHPFQARLKPAFDKSLFDKSPSYWKKLLGFKMASAGMGDVGSG
jgi:hypothetical protein